MSERSAVSGIPVEENESFDLRGVLYKYFNNWYWFVLSVIIFLIIGYVYLAGQTPVYDIKGKLLVKDNGKEAGSASASQGLSLNGFDMFSSDKLLDNEIQLLKSNTFLESSIRSLDLQVNVFYKDGLVKKDLYAALPIKVEVVKPNDEAYLNYIEVLPISNTSYTIDGKTYLFDRVVNTPYGIFVLRAQNALPKYIGKKLLLKVNDVNDLVDYYNTNLTVEAASSQGTVLLLELKDAVPQRGKDFITKLVQVYNLSSINEKNQVTLNSLRFINDRLRSISSELSGVESNVEQYKSNNQITDISTQSRIYLESLQQNDLELNKTLIQLNVLQNLESYLNGGDGARLPSTLGLTDATLNGLVSQLAQALNQKESLLRTTRETNPMVESLTDQITSLKKAIASNVQNIKSGLIITRNRLQTKSNQFETVIQKVPTKERGLLDVMRQQEIKNNLFTYLLEKREETSLTLASNISNTHVVDAPRSSKFPVSPKAKVIYAVFTMLGLIFPALVLFINDAMSYTVRSREEIEKLTLVPVISEISLSKDNKLLTAVESPRSVVAEQIRALRTNLNLASGTSPKIILFTSNISGEGKSFVSLNIGASFASIGKKVLIMELDLRKPKLHVNLNINNYPGLSDYLTGDINYTKIIQPIRQQAGYDIITCGTMTDSPAELLNSEKLNVLIETLKSQYDHIILDAPPVGLVTDAQILEKYADATMFIVRFNYTHKVHVQSINRLYLEHKFKNPKIIFNSIKQTRNGYGKDGYGYYQEAELDQPWYKRLTNRG
jgi:tyrosine-protein kinase Etk/Wzc